MLNFLWDNILWVLLLIPAVYIFLKVSAWGIRINYRKRQTKDLLFLRVTLPRHESSKDNQNEVEKDFREKIGIMAQFFRNLHETRELNFVNVVKTKLFKKNTFSFELVSHNKIVDFYITTPPYYKQIIEKQITSYYPDADIEIVEPYEFHPKGNKVKGYYAYHNQDFWYPIKTYKEVENDPLNSLTNIFSEMKEEETAVIQIVVRPIPDTWTETANKMGELYYKDKPISSMARIPVIGWFLNIMKGVFMGYEKMEVDKADDGGIVRMLQAKEDVAKRIGEKAGQSGFHTVIRLLSTAKEEKRAEEISNNMVVGLNLFRDNNSNWFQTRRLLFLDSLNDRWFLKNFKYRFLYSKFLLGEKKSLFSEQELASIFHFPSIKYNQSPIIRWMDYKVLPAPVELPKEGILLGHNVYRGHKKEIRFMRKDRTRHLYILGKSGSGKSAFLSYMARQDAINKEGFCVIDPHGDLVDDILTYIPKERAKDVVIYDPADIERPMGLNILEAKNPEERDLISSQATEIFIKIFGDEIFGPRIQHYFRNACLTLMEDEDEGATLIDIPRVFTDEAFLNYKVKKVKNPIVKSFWQNEYANTGDREKQEMIPYFSSKFGPFITNSIIRNTIGQVKSSFNFREIMDSGKILLVKLSKGTIGDLNTQLLGLVMVSKIQMAAMSRTDIPEEERKDFYLYVDEFQNFATDSFCSILSEARKFHLCLVMAHQYINQLVVSKFGTTSTQIRDAVFGNVGSMCSFKVGADDAEYLAKEYAPLLTEQDIIGISNYKMYLKLNINNTTSRPFSVNTIWDLTGKNDKIAEIVKEYSRLKYARKRDFVDQEITTRIGIDVDSDPVDMEKMGKDSKPAANSANPMAQILGGAMPPAAPKEKDKKE